MRTDFWVMVGVIFALVFVALKGDVGMASISIGGETITAQVADTYTQQQVGLSRYSSADDIGADGLLFIFDGETSRVMWMKGMKFSIDVVWIADGFVVLVKENLSVPEGDEQPERSDSSPLKVDMALELPAGTVKALGLKAGMPLDISLDGTPVSW